MASNNNDNNDDEQQVEGVDEGVSAESQNGTMASNNNDTRKKQKRATTAVTIDGDYVYPSSSTPDYLDVTLLTSTCTTALSLGTILQRFPELLFYVLPYIADRTVWFSIAASHKDLYQKSKLILPPWPMNYKFRPIQRCSPSWSPCGTRIACTNLYQSKIIVYDQRRGPLRFNGNNNRDCNQLPFITDLDFSANGSFLVTAGSAWSTAGFVRLWDNDVAGNYEQLQEWNMKEQEGINNIRHMNVSVSPCSKHIIVVVVTCMGNNHVFLKNVENGGETIRSLHTPQHPLMVHIKKIMFSGDGRAVFVCGWDITDLFIKVWHPYLDDASMNGLTTIWRPEQTHLVDAQNYDEVENIISHDGTMIAIHDAHRNNGWLLSIDNNNNHNCLTHKFNFPVRAKLSQRRSVKLSLLHFTPDNKYIVYSCCEGLKYWSVAESKFTDTNYFLYNNGKNTKNLREANYSPNNRQLIVRETNSQPTHNDHYYVTSFF